MEVDVWWRWWCGGGEGVVVVVWWWWRQWRRVGHLAEARAQLGLGLEVGVQRAVEEGEHL